MNRVFKNLSFTEIDGAYASDKTKYPYNGENRSELPVSSHEFHLRRATGLSSISDLQSKPSLIKKKQNYKAIEEAMSVLQIRKNVLHGFIIEHFL